MNKTNVVGWFDIYVNDMERAVSFYGTVLSTELVEIIDPSKETQMMSFPADMALYGAGGALVKSRYSKPSSGGSVVYFSVEDCGKNEKLVKKAGGSVLRPKFSIGEFGWVTLCRDTEGNTFGLSSMK